MVSGLSCEDRNMKCMYCQGSLKPDVAPFRIDRNGYHLVLEKVPALVCAQCGEVYFGEPEVDSIQAVIQTMDEQVERMAAVAA